MSETKISGSAPLAAPGAPELHLQRRTAVDEVRPQRGASQSKALA